MTTTDKIIASVLDEGLSERDLVALHAAIGVRIKQARRDADKAAIDQLEAGVEVTVTGHLDGDAYLGQTGEVVKVNRTKVEVDFGEGVIVKVPAGVLELDA